LKEPFVAQATLVDKVELAADDENPSFELWQWQGGQALTARLEQLWQARPMWVSPEVQFTQPEMRQTLNDAPRFGDVMALIGYRLDVGGGTAASAPTEGSAPATAGTPAIAGAAVELVTYWRALRTVEGEDDWSTFLHLLDAQSTVIGGVDVLNCPPTGWLPGDIAVQVHSFYVAEDAPPGEAVLEIGVYRRGSGRLPVWVGDQVTGDRVLLETLQIQ
jgi:hypothetical protein